MSHTDLIDLDMVRAICHKHLVKDLHDRHLEDCIQECVLLWLEGRKNIIWNVIEYCRRNGLSKRGKLSAMTIERSMSIDAPSISGESDNSEYLLNSRAIEIAEKNECCDILGAIEELLLPLKIKPEAMKWALKSYKVRTS